MGERIEWEIRKFIFYNFIFFLKGRYLLRLVEGSISRFEEFGRGSDGRMLVGGKRINGVAFMVVYLVEFWSFRIFGRSRRLWLGSGGLVGVEGARGIDRGEFKVMFIFFSSCIKKD